MRARPFRSRGASGDRRADHGCFPGKSTATAGFRRVRGPGRRGGIRAGRFAKPYAQPRAGLLRRHGLGRCSRLRATRPRTARVHARHAQPRAARARGRALPPLLQRAAGVQRLARRHPHGLLSQPHRHQRRALSRRRHRHRPRRTHARRAPQGTRLRHGHLRQVAPRSSRRLQSHPPRIRRVLRHPLLKRHVASALQGRLSAAAAHGRPRAHRVRAHHGRPGAAHAQAHRARGALHPRQCRGQAAVLRLHPASAAARAHRGQRRIRARHP